MHKVQNYDVLQPLGYGESDNKSLKDTDISWLQLKDIFKITYSISRIELKTSWKKLKFYSFVMCITLVRLQCLFYHTLLKLPDKIHTHCINYKYACFIHISKQNLFSLCCIRSLWHCDYLKEWYTVFCKSKLVCSPMHFYNIYAYL